MGDDMSPFASFDDMSPWLDLALFVSGPVCATTLLWIGGWVTARFMGVGTLLLALALSPLIFLDQFWGTVPDRLALGMMMFQFPHRFLTFCATCGGLGAILEKMSPARIGLLLTSSFMLGFLIGTAVFGPI
jgi:hypothetical protein